MSLFLSNLFKVSNIFITIYSLKLFFKIKRNGFELKRMIMAEINEDFSSDGESCEVLDLVKFLSGESDSSDEETIAVKRNIINEKLYAISEAQIENSFSYKANSDIIGLMNNMPDTKIKIPKYKAILKKMLQK